MVCSSGTGGSVGSTDHSGGLGGGEAPPPGLVGRKRKTAKGRTPAPRTATCTTWKRPRGMVGSGGGGGSVGPTNHSGGLGGGEARPRYRGARAAQPPVRTRTEVV